MVCCERRAGGPGGDAAGSGRLDGPQPARVPWDPGLRPRRLCASVASFLPLFALLCRFHGRGGTVRESRIIYFVLDRTTACELNPTPHSSSLPRPEIGGRHRRRIRFCGSSPAAPDIRASWSSLRPGRRRSAPALGPPLPRRARSGSMGVDRARARGRPSADRGRRILTCTPCEIAAGVLPCRKRGRRRCGRTGDRTAPSWTPSSQSPCCRASWSMDAPGSPRLLETCGAWAAGTNRASFSFASKQGAA